MLERIRQLSRDSAIYGFGDVAISVVNCLLLRVYVQYLSERDYGVLAVLGGVEVIAKIVVRWGLDGAFMRFFFDCDREEERQRLASTIFFFLLAFNGPLLLASLAAGPWFAERVLGSADHTLPLQLVLLNTFALGFTFFPFHVMRIEKRALEFSILTLARSAATVLLRLGLIVGLGFGVLGVVLADAVVTAVFLVILINRFASLIRPAFSSAVLRASLRFGLPRLPHAAAQQVIAVGDKFILQMFRPLSDVGMYSMGVSIGLTQKLFLSAFESAWAPFYYATAKEHDARDVFRTVVTYGVAVLVLLTAGLSAIARDLLDLLTRGIFVDAAAVVGWTALGVFWQGVYLLTSIGLNLTGRTEYYPVATLSAAGANVALNFLLIPRYGMHGAAWANVAAYVLQAGIAFALSQRFYPVRYEYGRMARLVASGAAAFLAASLVPDLHAAAGLLVRGTLVPLVFGMLLWATGFFKPEELRVLRRLRRVDRPGAPAAPLPETTELAGEIISTALPDERGRADARVPSARR